MYTNDTLAAPSCYVIIPSHTLQSMIWKTGRGGIQDTAVRTSQTVWFKSEGNFCWHWQVMSWVPVTESEVNSRIMTVLGALVDSSACFPWVAITHPK